MLGIKRTDHFRVSAMQMAMHFHGMNHKFDMTNMAAAYASPSPDFKEVFRTYEVLYARMIKDAENDEIAAGTTR